MSKSLCGPHPPHQRGAALHSAASRELGHDGRVACSAELSGTCGGFRGKELGTPAPYTPATISRSGVPSLAFLARGPWRRPPSQVPGVQR